MGNIEQVYGKYNEVPAGWRELSEAEFSKSMLFNYSPEKHEFRQFDVGPDPTAPDDPYRDTFGRVFMYHFFDGTGVAMVPEHWRGRVRYFAFGCTHDYREMTGDEARSRGIDHWGHCYHVYECRICKRVLAQDSSD